MEILSALSRRLQQAMRTRMLTYADLSQLYQAEEHLNTLGEVLQRLELKHASQLDALRILMHNTAARLENSDNGVSVPHDAALTPEKRLSNPVEQVKWVYVVQPDPLPNVQVATESTPRLNPGSRLRPVC